MMTRSEMVEAVIRIFNELDTIVDGNAYSDLYVITKRFYDSSRKREQWLFPSTISVLGQELVEALLFYEEIEHVYHEEARDAERERALWAASR